MQNPLYKIPDWELAVDGSALTRTFIGNNFIGALVLANKIGLLCDQEVHYPEITVGQNYCYVVFKAQQSQDLQENDFIIAFKINQLLSRLRDKSSRAGLEQFTLAT